MGLIDSIIGAESGGDATAKNPNSLSDRVWKICRLPYVFVKPRIVGILELLFVGCPAAIRWFIVAVCLTAINRMFRGGLRPHVGEEVLKASDPALTYLDALRPVVFVADVGGPRTSFLHRAPSSIFGPFFHSMRKQRCSRCFFMKAPATLRSFGCQAMLSDNGDVPTIACAAIAAYLASLAAMFVHLWGDFEVNHEPSNPLAC